MRKNRAREDKRALRGALVALTNAVTLNSMDSEDVLVNVAICLAYSEEKDLRRELPKLLAKTKIRTALSFFSRDLAKFSVRPTFNAPHKNLIAYYEKVLVAESKLISEFASLAKEYEGFFLVGKYDEALEVLDSILEATGESLWLIRSRMLTLAQAGRLDEVKKYCDVTKEACGDSFTSFLLNCFLLLATDPVLHSKRYIRAAIKELEQAGISGWADFLELLLSAQPISRKGKVLTCYKHLQSFSLVDQYMFLSQLLVNNAASSEGMKIPENEARLLELLRRFSAIDLDQVDRVRSAKLYECGEYTEVINEYRQVAFYGSSSVVMASLAAKSLEMIHESNDLFEAGALAEIVGALRGLYSLNVPSAQSIDALIAMSIQTQHMMCGAAVQLLLYQALPNQFSEEDRRLASRKVMLSYGDDSSWLITLAKDNDPVLHHVYASDIDFLPRDRVLKSAIRNNCITGDTANLHNEIQEFGRICKLRRDYYELASAAYIHVGEMGRLVALCADALTNNSNAYTSFPLTALVAHIEGEGLCDLDSLVVIYFYVKNVDASKEYVLNEAYEEFLFSRNLRRPSDILALQAGGFSGEESKKVQLLLRDISSVETLDFLAVFDSSNDVRAERLKILDLLLREGGVTAERHRSEVEEILNQVIVDSGATEFSVNKIDVNEAAIKRKLSEDISSLFVLYRSSSSNDNAFIKIKGDSEKDAAAAVVAGDKNTTLLKIFSAVCDAFLYDEKFGLDKNLSAEIRHGFFSNLIRSKLEERHLLTEKDESGSYKKNEYWYSTNSILTSDCLLEIDGHLRWFSEELNGLIAKAEEWMKVTREKGDGARVFDYTLYAKQFAPIGMMADQVRSSDELLDVILKFLWMITEHALEVMRERIDIDFRGQVDQVFQGLLERLDQTRGNLPMYELMNAVRRTRNDIREDISTVTEWFKRVGTPTSKIRTVNELIAVSVECYYRVRKIQVNPSIEIGAGEIDIAFEGQSRGLIVALLNLYENCIRHGGYGTDSRISVCATQLAEGWSLAISNPVTVHAANGLISGGLEALRQRINEPAYAGLVRTEGGSGLRKVSNQLAAVSDRFKLRIRVDSSNADSSSFTAEIIYDPKNTVD